MSRVVVVGAGVGGLAAAVRLGALGHEVTVLEQADEVGGKLVTETHHGFVFDTGPSLLTIPSVYEELFAETGAPLRAELDLRPVHPAFRYRFPDGTVLDLPDGGGPRTAQAIEAALGDGTGAQWTAFMERAGRMWEATRGPFLESPLDGARGLLRESRKVGDD